MTRSLTIIPTKQRADEGSLIPGGIAYGPYAFKVLFLLGGLFCTLMVPRAEAQGSRAPYVGYLYPAGGQRGTEFTIFAGGRNLRGITAATVSGKGVRVTIESYMKPTKNTEAREQYKEAKVRLREEMKGKRGTDGVLVEEIELMSATDDLTLLEWSYNPFYADYSKMTIHELRRVSQTFNQSMRQANPQLADVVKLKVSIDRDAQPGYRELRLSSNVAACKPIRFHVDTLPEFREIEPNGPEVETRTLVELPALINGQIRPGDVDRFRITSEKGAKLVIDVHARQLIPFLADAVPGWFQATVAIFDSNGNELAYVDDFQFKPDPVVFFEVPQSGDYLIEIKDAIFRGREDFVYRMRIGELPYITSVFPLGGQLGSKCSASIQAVNLPVDQTTIKFRKKKAAGKVQLWKDDIVTNTLTVSATALPSMNELEPNNDRANAQSISLPHTINGQILSETDVDVFSFSGKAGETVVAEVHARRLDSPLDSLIQLTDHTGKVLCWNDDFKVQNTGYLTHQADSYIIFTLPADGVYYVHIKDTQGKGSMSHNYVLRLSHPIPKFTVYMAPSGINVPAGKTVPVQATVIRQDGFNGAVNVSLKDPQGFKLEGTTIPAGVERVYMTLTAPNRSMAKPHDLAFQAHAVIGGKEVMAACVPADDVMQAFLWRHLVETGTSQAIVSKLGNKLPTYHLVKHPQLQLYPGARIKLRAIASRPVKNGTVKLALYQPPKGVTIETMAFSPKSITFSIAVDENAKLAGNGNLVLYSIGTFTGNRNGKKGGKGKVTDKKSKNTKTWTTPLGALPAIPYVIGTKAHN